MAKVEPMPYAAHLENYYQVIENALREAFIARKGDEDHSRKHLRRARDLIDEFLSQHDPQPLEGGKPRTSFFSGRLGNEPLESGESAILQSTLANLGLLTDAERFKSGYPQCSLCWGTEGYCSLCPPRKDGLKR